MADDVPRIALGGKVLSIDKTRARAESARRERTCLILMKDVVKQLFSIFTSLDASLQQQNKKTTIVPLSTTVAGDGP